jgi:hypothetical protein
LGRRDARSGIINEHLLSRLKRCEELLQAHGLQIEDDRLGGEKDTSMKAAPVSKSEEGQMIVEHGQSRYVEKYDFRFSKVHF